MWDLANVLHVNGCVKHLGGFTLTILTGKNCRNDSLQQEIVKRQSCLSPIIVYKPIKSFSCLKKVVYQIDR